MAEDFLEEIYQISNIYNDIFEIRDWAQKGINELVIDGIKRALPGLGKLGKLYISKNTNNGAEYWENLHKISMYSGDNVWIVDFIDREFVPQINGFMTSWPSICVQDENGLCLESSDHGFLTIKDIGKSYYFHSRFDPMQEAREQVLNFYNPKVRTYAFLGCGLGYLAYQLYRISDGTARIHLFYFDDFMLTYGRKYGVLDWIPTDNLKITVGNDIMPFLKCAEEENHDFFIFRPEIEYWPENAQRIIKRLYTNQCTSLAFRRQSEINFYSNMSCGAQYIAEANFAWLKAKHDYIVVAAGPSVDDNIQFLKKCKGEIPILAVGTVFKKLISEGIRPDIVVVMDPSYFTMEQLEEIEGENIPLLISTTAYWRWGSLYKGKKYLVPVLSGRCEQANIYAKNMQEGGWDCGGTVTIMATRAALYFGATRIYLIGADFAYPNGYTHATGTSNRIKKDITKLFAVEDSFGGTVYTEEVMDMYRRRMEDLIEEENKVEFINLSRIGAKIKGCTILDD